MQRCFREAALQGAGVVVLVCDPHPGGGTTKDGEQLARAAAAGGGVVYQFIRPRGHLEPSPMQPAGALRGFLRSSANKRNLLKLLPDTATAELRSRGEGGGWTHPGVTEVIFVSAGGPRMAARALRGGGAAKNDGGHKKLSKKARAKRAKQEAKRAKTVAARERKGFVGFFVHPPRPVSYTHLTLPTIYSV